jgi:hypothetical protein
VALFGRKINNAECQLAFVHFLRLIVDGAISPEDAVKAYHAVLEKLGIRPQRSLADDLILQTGVMSYGGSSSASVPAAIPAAAASSHTSSADQAHSHSHAACGCGGPSKAECRCQSGPAAAETPAAPDFGRMTQAEKLAYNKARRDRIFG